MKVLVTGGSGFIGRWVSRKFLDEGAEVHIYDSLINGSVENINDFRNEINFVKADIRDKRALETIFRNKFDVCIHAAAQINVQNSIDDPENNFEVNVVGSENVLRECHRTKCTMVHIGSCMVYDTSSPKGISETHALLPKSPYASSKLAADYNALSYHYAYGDDVVVLRPFNVYGPFQKANTEGGVVSIFVKQSLLERPVTVFEPGIQTRDLLYVEDCAEFVFKAAISDNCSGTILNAGYGKDIRIIDLAKLITMDSGSEIKLLKHPHPQSEISTILSNSRKARNLLCWEPKIEITEGIRRLKRWMIDNQQ